MAHHPEIVSELIVCEGNAATELVDKSKGADMLVVGSRGLGGFRGLLLGRSGSSAPSTPTAPS
jgi:nucleotide-binding universal stress UspA family protein